MSTTSISSSLKLHKNLENFFGLGEIDRDTFEIEKFSLSRMRFLIELTMFLSSTYHTPKNGFRDKKYYLNSISRLFQLVRKFLEKHTILNEFQDKKKKIVDCMITVLFQKLALFNNRSDVLAYLNQNENVKELLTIDYVYSSSEHSKIKELLQNKYDMVFFDLIVYLRSQIKIENLTIHDIFHYLQNLDKITKDNLISFHKIKNYGKDHYVTSWVGLMFVVYAMYSLGIIHILESFGTAENKAKGHNGYTIPQISMCMITETLLSFESPYESNEKIEDDALLRILCSLKNGHTPSQSTLNRDIQRYDPKEVENVYESIVSWLHILGVIKGDEIIIDGSKLPVDGELYENMGNVHDKSTNSNEQGYKIMTVLDVDSKCPILLELHPINTSENNLLEGIIEKAKKILGDNCIKKAYIDRGSYSVDNFAYLMDENIDFITKGKSNTRFYNEAKEIANDVYEEIIIGESYIPRTERGKKSQKERMKSLKPKLFAEKKVCFTKNNKEYTMRMIVQKRITGLSKRDKVILLLNKQKTSKTAAELLKLYETEYNESFSSSKNPIETMRGTLLNIRSLSRDRVPKKEGSKQKVYKFQLRDEIKINTIEGNTKKLIFKIWLTTIDSLKKQDIIVEYKKRWRVELFFKEEKGEWGINNFPSKKFDAITTFIYFKFIAYLIIAVFKRCLTEEYRDSGIDKIKLYIIEKVGFIRTKDDYIEVELYGKSYIERMNEQLQNMKGYIAGLDYD